MPLQRLRRNVYNKVRLLPASIKSCIRYVMMLPPRTGKDLYNKVQPPAEAVKGYMQIAIGIAVIIIFVARWVDHPSHEEFNIAKEALSLVGYGLAASAAVELAYTFFTKGPDEALDPLILGVSSFTLIALSRIDPPRLKTSDTIPISLLALVIMLLFLTRRFMLEIETESPRLEGSDARLALWIGQKVREQRTNLKLSQDELASRAGIAKQALAEIEAGKSLPTIPVLQLISIALGTQLIVEIADQIGDESR